MKYITGIDRTQLVIFPTSLDAAVEQDNEVRLIDLFVDIGFTLDRAEAMRV